MKKLTKIQQTVLDKLKFKQAKFGYRYYHARFINAAPKTLNSLVRMGLLETKVQRTYSASKFSTTYRVIKYG